MTNLVVHKVINGRVHKLRLVWVGSKVISEGVVKLERVQVICPACGHQVEAVAGDGQVKGYCAVAKQHVDFLIETQRVPTDKNHTDETRAKLSAATKKLWQDPEYRAKQITTHTGKHYTAEARTKKSAASKKYWQDPEYRAKHSATTKKLWEDPEYRARQIAARTGKHLTAEHRAKISAALKRRHDSERGSIEEG